MLSHRSDLFWVHRIEIFRRLLPHESHFDIFASSFYWHRYWMNAAYSLNTPLRWHNLISWLLFYYSIISSTQHSGAVKGFCNRQPLCDGMRCRFVSIEWMLKSEQPLEQRINFFLCRRRSQKKNDGIKMFHSKEATHSASELCHINLVYEVRNNIRANTEIGKRIV